MSGGDDEHLAHAGPCLSSMIWQWIFILRHTHGWFCSGPVPSRPPVLIVVQGSSRIFQEGNLLVTGVNTFCIFNPRKCLQTGSCHPGKWVCDLYPPPLAESEWWKLQTPPGGPAARLGVGLWSKAFICPAGAPSALSSKNQLRAGAETVWKDLQKKCGNSYLDSAFQSVAFALQRIEFLTWRALLTFFERKKKKKLPWVDGVCQLPANSVSRLVQFVEKLQRAQVQTRVSFFSFSFFWELSIQQTKTTEDTWCAGS